MKFGFDIDDTLINLREHAFRIYTKRLKQDLSLETFKGINRVEIHEPFGLTDAEGKEMWTHSLEEIYYTDCPAFPGARETLLDLAEEGHEIYYITARPKEHGIRTREWMKEKGFPITDDRFFYGMQDEEKVKIIEELELDYYVDDKPAVLKTLLHTPIQLIVKDQSYNKDLEMERLIDWDDFKSMIKMGT
ncbi:MULTISPECIES: 5' nucleotidase, NT5C type [unclassified Oceanobacillus]|uniref:5' nucleotidase, NT5C type n=1 Tax=unclassified Oceanobacillus TaxID=2630292 RepID=UPI00300E0214